MAATPEPPARIEPVEPRRWSSEAVEAVNQMAPPPGSVYEQRRKARGGSGGVNALGLLARHPALSGAFLGFNRHLLYASRLDERVRELVVLRVAWVLGSAYEWAQHVPVAQQCGLGSDDIDRVAEGPEAQGWSEFDRALLEATDSLLETGHIEDAVWERLAAAYDEETLLDLVFTVGGYATLAMAFNAARIQLDPDLEGFPEEPSA